MPTLQYVYPDSTELKGIEQDLLPQMIEQDTVFFQDLFPLDMTSTSYKLEWEQLDNFFGLQQARGLDGQPAPVARVGSNRYSEEPGVYGEYAMIDEKEMTRRGEHAKYTGHVDLTDLVMQAQQQLLQRRLDRIRSLGWALLTTGQYSVSAPNGGYDHRGRYLFTTLTSSPGWSTVATATPFKDILALNTAGRGTSSKFGGEAKLYMNAVTVARMLNNTNSADLGGRYRIGGGDTVNDLANFNKVNLGRNLPQVVQYDEGWSSGSNTVNTFTPFIPDGVAVLVGKRPNGSPVGMYRMTINANADMKAEPYTQVIDNAGREVPRTVQVHDGHSGGPVILFPSAVRILNVG